MVITDPALLKGRDAVAVCRGAVAGGATMIQVRWKDGMPAEVLELTRALVAALPVPVLVNDRADIALAAGAAGAHLGGEDVPLEALRPRVPPGFLLGISVGSVAEAARAPASADYWSVGPCFATPTKADAGPPLGPDGFAALATPTKADAGPPLGPDGFAALAKLAPESCPVIGIGGISVANAGLIKGAGAVGVAVIGAVLTARDPESATRELTRSLQ